MLPKHVESSWRDKVGVSGINQSEKSTGRKLGITNIGDERQLLVLDCAKQAGHVTRRQAQEVTGLSQSAAANLLKALTENGMLMKVGKGSSTKYRLRDDIDEQQEEND